MLAHAGKREQATRILQQYSSRIGPNAAIERLHDDLKAGDKISFKPITLQQGAALSVLTPAASLAAQTRDDLSGIYFALALELDPELDLARTLWADALDNANRRDDAIAILNSVSTDSVFYTTARGQLAWALRREELNAEALKTARAALTASPDRNLKIQLGDLLRSLDELDDAEHVFSEIIDSDRVDETEDWRIYFARGAVRVQLGKWQTAEADLKRANLIAPNQPSVMNYLGYTWIDRGENLEAGLEMIKRAVLLRPNSGAIVDSLGWAHYKLGNYDKAVHHLERAVELSPSDLTLNEHLGDAYWRADRKLEASYQWNRTIRIDPESPNVLSLQSKVSDGLDRAEARASARKRTD